MGYQKPLYLATKRNVYYYTRRVLQSLEAQFQSCHFYLKPFMRTNVIVLLH